MELNTFIQQLFPFFIKINENLEIYDAGKSILKIYPKLIGKKLEDQFNILRPKIIDHNLFSEERLHFLTILRCRKHGYIFRGQFYKTEESSRYFFCNPWVTNANELIKMGINLSDFPIHDQTGDLLLAINQEEIRTKDITELTEILSKINTRLKIAKEEAESSLEAKSAFLANMSHEIRTPMNAILGLSKLINENHLEETEKEYLHAIQSSANNLLTIINDILDFSKIQADKLDIRETPVNLQHELNQLYNTFRKRTEKKHLHFSITQNTNENLNVLTDPVRLNQILTNLINNAIKFTNEGNIELIFESKKTTNTQIQASFIVKDTGIGISPNFLNCIFESFTQADSTSTKKYGGTGLGLAISQNLAKLMGGNISVESNLNIGSIFTVTLPFSLTSQSPTNNITTCKNTLLQFKPFTILLAEDNEYNQLLSKVILKKLGAKTIIANHGKEAIELIEQEHNIDLILMDIQMPIMNGIECMKIIKKQHKTPIIALTANALKGDKERFLNEGFDDYLSKPFSQIELQTILIKYIPTEPKTTNPSPQIPNSQNNAKRYDLHKLKQFCNNDPDFFLILLKKFIETSGEAISIMQTKNLTNTELANLAHKMIPSYNSLGIKKIVTLLHLLEHEIEQLTKEKITTIKQQIISETQNINNELINELNPIG